MYLSLHIPGSVCVGVTLWFGCGSVQAEALLACSCGMWGLGVNDHLEQGVGFSWARPQNEFAFLVEGLDIVLFLKARISLGYLQKRLPQQGTHIPSKHQFPSNPKKTLPISTKHTSHKP